MEEVKIQMPPWDKLPIECQHFAAEIYELDAERKQLQAELKDEDVGAGPTKWGIVKQIAAIDGQIERKRSQLNACIIAHGGKTPLSARFTGSGTIKTNYRGAEGPMTKDVNIKLWFDEDRTKIMIEGLSPIKTEPFHTPLGKNTTTVTLIGQGVGVFDSASGMIGIPVKLLFDHSIDIPFYEEDSTLDIVLSTESVSSVLGNAEGSRLDGEGQLTLVGASQFRGGILNGYWCVINMIGLISPHP